jgi:hypothetical protein
MKVYGRVYVWIHVILTLALVEGDSATQPSRFIPRKEPDVQWIEGWLGPRACLDDVRGEKILPIPGLNSDLSSIASRYTDLLGALQ